MKKSKVRYVYVIFNSKAKYSEHTEYSAIKSNPDSDLYRLGIEILSYHQGNLEGNSVFKLTEIESCELSDLLKSVYKSVSMYEKLS